MRYVLEVGWSILGLCGRVGVKRIDASIEQWSETRTRAICGTKEARRDDRSGGGLGRWSQSIAPDEHTVFDVLSAF